MISIIVPTFNSQSTIRRTIESVLSQTYTDFELLVIDNGSSDDTIQQVKRYRDDRIKVLYSDAGRSNARNFGLSVAQGDYLVFLDSDDEFQEEHLKRGVTFLTDNADFFAYMDDSLLIKNGQSLGAFSEIRGKSTSSLLMDNFIPISAVIFRNFDISKFHTELSHDEDWLFWIENLVDKSLYIDGKKTGSFIHVTGNNSMTDIRILGNKFYVYACVKLDIHRVPVSLKQLIKSGIWFWVSAGIHNQTDLTETVKKAFPVVSHLTRFIVVLPKVKTIMRKRISRANARYF